MCSPWVQKLIPLLLPCSQISKPHGVGMFQVGLTPADQALFLCGWIKTKPNPVLWKWHSWGMMQGMAGTQCSHMGLGPSFPFPCGFPSRAISMQLDLALGEPALCVGLSLLTGSYPQAEKVRHHWNYTASTKQDSSSPPSMDSVLAKTVLAVL